MTSDPSSFLQAGRKLSASGSTLYHILGVPKGADEDDIKRAYRKAALRFHPDKNPDNPAAADIFKDVSRAYRALVDPVKRSIYDKYGSLGLSIAEQVGEDNVNTYFMLSSKWCKALFFFCCAITGCYFCCCCCFCCNFCFGKFKPGPHEPTPEEINLRDEELDDLAHPMHQAAPPYNLDDLRQTQFNSSSYPSVGRPMPPPTGNVITRQPPSTMSGY
ncbi:DnaJ -like protein subfamily C member 5 [Echinococcus granulosus]|uniref:Cysteine string protein n=1 Tax=Echinococcus granulosus TaxID=6210 RepID=A0A068WBS0_ECHGR|nr:DnaJ -like protein subfamily C member 5 [Echinococcus granulosus]CDS17542.1 cysteine string protein [Echinococcus granulosus]